MLLANIDEMFHLHVDVVPNPNFGQVRCIYLLENDSELTCKKPN
jgi:hypothetical protein